MLASFFVFAVILGSIIYTMNIIKNPVTIKENEAADEAVGVTVFTSPTTVSTIKGESFIVDLDIDTQGQEASGADLVFEYDPVFLRADSIIPRDFFPKVLKKDIGDNGKISLVLAADPGILGQGSGTMVSINFTAIATGSTILNYNRISQVAASDKLVNILTSSLGTTVNINDKPDVKSLETSAIGSVITIFASGTKANDHYPTMELVINDETTSIFYNVNEKLKKYIYQHSTKVTPNQIRVKFTNDLNDRKAGEDRNLRVEKIRIDEKDYITRDKYTYSIGTWSPGGCGSGYKKSEWLYCNGEFEYSSKGR